MDSAAAMMADLGNAHRDFISTPHETGRSARMAERQEAATKEESEARRRRIVEGATDETNKLHVAIKKWNTPEIFKGGDGFDDLENRCDGQGHRRALAMSTGQSYDQRREYQENRVGEERRMYMDQRGGSMPRSSYPPPLPRASRPPLANANPNRQRAPSPRAQGTVRFAPGRARQGHTAAPTSSLHPNANAIPTIGAQLATAVQAASGVESAPSTRPPQQSTSSNNANVASARVRHAAPDADSSTLPPWPTWDAPPAARASLPANPAVARAQTRIKELAAAQQKAVSASAGSSTSTRSTPPPAVEDAASIAAASTGTGASPPMAVPAPGAPTRLPPHQQAHHQGPNTRATAARSRVTGNVSNNNGSVPSTTVPRMRATGSTAESAPANGIINNATGPRTRATAAASPTVSSASLSASESNPAPRASAVQDVNIRAQATRLFQDGTIKVKALVSAVQRTPKELQLIEKHYQEFPEHLPALVYARQAVARKVVQLAQDGRQEEIEDYLQFQNPCRRYLVDAAIAARAGRTPENADHPTIQEILKMTVVEKAATESKAAIQAPSAQPMVSNGVAGPSGSPDSSATAETASTAASTPTPPRSGHGILSAAFFDVNGRFKSNKEYQLSVPVAAQINITTKNAEYDPLQLADAMEAFAYRFSNPTGLA